MFFERYDFNAWRANIDLLMNSPPPSLSYALAHHLNILEPPLPKDALRQV